MTDSEQLSVLPTTTVNCYLTTLLAVADCLGAACPEVGGPYRHRLNRLGSRLAFDTTPEALLESATAIEEQLKEYAVRASYFVAQHGVELRRGIKALEGIVCSLAQRQDFYGARLRQFAAQMDTTPYPTDPDHLREVVALQVVGLLGCVESMSHDTESLVIRMRDELAAVAERLRESETTDPLTGLMNRREMEREIDTRQEAGRPVTLLLFDVHGDIRDEVAQQLAARLGSQFRHHDLICRWTDHEFLVLFDGTPASAEARIEHIMPWVSGRYLLDTGDTVDIRVEARLTDIQVVR